MICENLGHYYNGVCYLGYIYTVTKPCLFYASVYTETNENMIEF